MSWTGQIQRSCTLVQLILLLKSDRRDTFPPDKAENFDSLISNECMSLKTGRTAMHASSGSEGKQTRSF
jgi:hypothetical protein